MKTILGIILVTISLISYIYAAEKEHIYSTWDTIELDTCASAWLIKRFVDTKAEFKFYPKGGFITEGIPFDTPDAELRRRHGISTFESIIAKYKINNPVVLEIGRFIHEIEVGYWNITSSKEAKELNDKVNLIISENKDPQEILKGVFLVMDKLYSDIKP